MPKLSMMLRALVMAALVALATPADAATVYVGDDAGNVGRYDTVTMATSFVGTIAGFSPSQALGLAFDAATNSVLILDRGSDRVFTMDATSGASALLFNSTGTFQGGAVSNGLLYGTQEGGPGETPVAAFTFGGTQTVFGSVSPSHTHSMGVDAATGQLYNIGGDEVVREVNADGTYGMDVVTAIGLFEFVDDLDYLDGDFLVTQFGNRVIGLVDGGTGAFSVYLTSDQLNAMGVVGNASGVVVGSQVIPEPASLALSSVGLIGALFVAARRRRVRGS